MHKISTNQKLGQVIGGIRARNKHFPLRKKLSFINSQAGDGSVVDMNYRPHGVDNVYVTGSGLFPTAGSWNPTLMMTALSLHLSDSVAVKEGVCGNANSKGPNPKGPNPKGPNPKGPN